MKRRALSDASDGSSSVEEYKVLSNKTVNSSNIPPKPSNMGLKQILPKKPFDFRMTFINGILLQKFLLPASKAVKKMRFVICNPESPTAFHGFKIECHDPSFTLADRGLFECDIESGTSKNIDGTTFCVCADAFMEALRASSQRETDLCITRFLTKELVEEDFITFESINNENDVRARYTCSLLDFSQVDTLDGISIDLGFHATVQMSILKELSLNAKNCKATTLKFDLWQSVDSKDSNVTHSKMSIGFRGEDGHASGSHDFCITMRREESSDLTSKKTTWTPISSENFASEFTDQKMAQKCSNEYDNKKLRKIIKHMECPYVLVHLCTDNTPQPLVLDCEMGGHRTKHTLIVVPKCED